MVSKIVNDLSLGISTDGILVAPDYGTSKSGVKIDKGAQILIPTHRNLEGDLLQRVCEKYDSILEGLKITRRLEPFENCYMWPCYL